MVVRVGLFLLFSGALSYGTIIDRIAVLVASGIVKDSDIQRDIRLTSFLNQETLSFSADSRRKSASRLIEQQLIREEIRVGRYAIVPQADAEKFLEEIKKPRFPTEDQYRRALSTYGLSQAELLERVRWQLSVLRFIDQRFRPAILVTDTDIKNYYDQHSAELRRDNKGTLPPLEDVRGKVNEVLAGERISKLFDEWLDLKRKSSKIIYREETLQ